MRILEVEDDERILDPLAEALRDRHYTVDVAREGQAGLTLAQSIAYDLMVVDWMLPRLSGVELCRQLRQEGQTMPILILTGRDTSRDKVDGLDAGADDYVVKPFDLSELLARVRALLRRGAVAASPVLSWGALQLDPRSCEVTYRSTLVALSPKEYALLELFLRHPGRTFDRAAILDNLWNFDEPPTEEAITAHIRRLRQKLTEAGAPKTAIETRYGMGYRLNPNLPDNDPTG
ncbi:MAG TPA: response regulator transcription factor [Coleofasciculaceae cyanobacterium]